MVSSLLVECIHYSHLVCCCKIQYLYMPSSLTTSSPCPPCTLLYPALSIPTWQFRSPATTTLSLLVTACISLSMCSQNLLSNLKKALFPNQLATKIDALTLQVSHLTSQLDKKVERIAELETKVQSLEDANDALEQYSRRPNIRISGIAETTDGEDTDEKVLAVINGKMNLQPPCKSGRSNEAIASAARPSIASVMSVAPLDRGLSSCDCVVSASVMLCSDHGLASRNTTGKIRITRSS